MSAPDPKEKGLIAQFRVKLADVLPTFTNEQKTDLYLVRWIRAREGNLDLAEKMLRRSLDWREENDMANILTWTPPGILTHICPVEFLGYDKFNSPVSYIPIGKWDLRRVIQLGHKDKFLKLMDQMFEQSMEKMKGKVTPTGEPVTQAVYIADMEFLSIRTVASVGVLDMLLQAVKGFEANQPETVRRIFILNAGAAFSSLFSLMKPLLSDRTFGKMFIFSAGNLHKYSFKKETLFQDIPLDVLPIKLGGNNKEFKDLPCSDESAFTDQWEGPVTLSVTVPPSDKLALVINVEEAMSTISWSFRTDKYDIAFGIHCGKKDYVENSRVNSHLEPNAGSIVCDKPGEYIFTFDNRYSRLRPKALQYKIDVTTPEGTDQVSFK